MNVKVAHRGDLDILVFENGDSGDGEERKGELSKSETEKLSRRRRKCQCSQVGTFASNDDPPCLSFGFGVSRPQDQSKRDPGFKTQLWQRRHTVLGSCSRVISEDLFSKQLVRNISSTLSKASTYIKMDTVFLHGIKAELIVGQDAWHRENKSQPVVLNIDLIPLDTLEGAANEDNVALTLDYGKLYKSLTRSLSSQAYPSIHHLFLFVQECLPPVRSSSVEIILPKAILLADEGLSVTRKTIIGEDVGPAVYQRLEIRKIQCKCVVGVNPHERIDKQRLILNVSAEGLSTPLATAVVAGVSLDTSARPAYVEAARDIVEVSDFTRHHLLVAQC